MFTERERLVIYLEKSDILRMTAKAKENRETLIEWARGVLRNELTIEMHRPPEDLQKPRNVPLVERSVVTPGRPKRVEGASNKLVSSSRTCKHGMANGYHCWQCGGVAVIE
jgi:hypothetical protein